MDDAAAEGWRVEGGFFEANGSVYVVLAEVRHGIHDFVSYIKLNGFATGVSTGTWGILSSAMASSCARSSCGRIESGHCGSCSPKFKTEQQSSEYQTKI